jgi:hypothetical protein
LIEVLDTIAGIVPQVLFRARPRSPDQIEEMH